VFETSLFEWVGRSIGISSSTQLNSDLTHIWTNVNVGIFASPVTVQRQGGIKTFKISTYLADTTNGIIGNEVYALCTLPVEYRPRTLITVNAIVGRNAVGTTSTAFSVLLEINDSGVVTMTPFQNIKGNAINLMVAYA